MTGALADGASLVLSHARDRPESRLRIFYSTLEQAAVTTAPNDALFDSALPLDNDPRPPRFLKNGSRPLFRPALHAPSGVETHFGWLIKGWGLELCKNGG